MMRAVQNPGNIAYRIGVTLGIYEDAVARRDWETADAMVNTVGTYVSVHLKDPEVKKWRAMPGFQYGDTREARQVFEDLNDKLLAALRHAKKHNLFAKTEVETGDASGLDEEEAAEA